jgi:hypothetical protein
MKVAPIVGVWRLVSFEARRSDGEVVHPFGPDPHGALIYTPGGRFSVHLMRAVRPRLAAGDPLQGTVAEMEANYKGVITYYGSYRCDAAAGFVVHQVEGSLFPNWQGQELRRAFAIDGNRLTLTTTPTLWGGGGQIVGTVAWERVE